MKNLKILGTMRSIAIVAAVVAVSFFALSLTGCEGPAGPKGAAGAAGPAGPIGPAGTDGQDYVPAVTAPIEKDATAATFDSVFKEIRTTPGSYVINLTGDLPDYPGIALSTPGVEITVKGTGNNTISWLDNGGRDCLFSVSAGKLIIQDIKLAAAAGNNQVGYYYIINIQGGIVELKDGAHLSNSNTYGSTGGVWLNVEGSELIVSGGTIEDCGDCIEIYGCTGTSVTVTSGLIDGTYGIYIGDSGHNIVVSGGKINTQYNAISMQGVANTVTVSGAAEIISVDGYGIRTDGENQKLFINGGRISGNDGCVDFWAKDSRMTMTAGEISGSQRNGVDI